MPQVAGSLIFFGASARDVASRLLLHEDEQFKGVIFNCIKSGEVRPFVDELASHCNMRRRRTSPNESKIILLIALYVGVALRRN